MKNEPQFDTRAQGGEKYNWERYEELNKRMGRFIGVFSGKLIRQLKTYRAIIAGDSPVLILPTIQNYIDTSYRGGGDLDNLGFFLGTKCETMMDICLKIQIKGKMR